MILSPHHARPYGLPLRLALGGAAMAALYLLVQGGSLPDTARALFGLLQQSDGVSLSLLAALRSLVVMSLALVTACAAAVTLVRLARLLFPSLTGLLSILGWLLFATPLLGLVWAWAGWWIGTEGGVIETLLPPSPHGIGEPFAEAATRHLWTWLAPVLALSVPLTGLLLRQFSACLRHTATAPLTGNLRSRGHPSTRIFDHHLLPLLWPAWHRCVESALPAVLVLDLVVEYALHFPGWGGGFVNALQTADPPALAFGLQLGGLLAAALCLILRLFRPHAPTSLSSSAQVGFSLPDLLIVCTIVLAAIILTCTEAAGPLHLNRTPLSSGETWWPSLENDLRACLRIVGLALIGGPILASLRLTPLGVWLRRYGSLETLSWSPLAVWALAWSHTSGQVISIDLSLAALASVTLSIHLYSSARRHTASPVFEASRSLGASAWQAWHRHALRPWTMEFCGALLALTGSILWLRILSHSLLPAEKTPASASLGSFLARAAEDAIHHPLPLLSASMAAAVSILSLWALSRIIHHPHPDDA